MPSIVKTLNKIVIPRYVYDKLSPCFYDERHIKPIAEQFHFFVKKRLDKLEHTYLSTEWNHNMDTSIYMEQS